MMAAPTLAQLASSLESQALPIPSSLFLHSILHGSSRQQPLPALVATARHRLLSCDLTSNSLPVFSVGMACFPPNIMNVRVPSSALSEDIFVQVLDVEDVGRSKWDQIETLELKRRGETTKGREIIRVVPTADQDPSLAASHCLGTKVSNYEKGPFKLLLQDWKGNLVWGFEMKQVDKIGYPPAMSIGCKIWLRKGCRVARGMLLLEPATVMVIGGKIESADKTWRDGQENRLRDVITGPKHAVREGS